MATFKTRTTAPALSNKYYLHTTHGGYNPCMLRYNGTVLPNCVGYAYGRFMEVMGKHSCKLCTGDAHSWYGYKSDGYKRSKSTPRVGATIVYSHGNAAGHVAAVEKVYKNGDIMISQSGYSCSWAGRFWTQRLYKSSGYAFNSGYGLLGFIYNPAVSSSGVISVDGSDDDTEYDEVLGIAKEDIKAEYISNYILTITRKTTNPDYKTMAKKKVVGVLIEAGYLYNSSHNSVKNPRNPYLEDQCMAASKADMPWGLYWTIRSKTVNEAKAELYQLTFIIRKYPPQIGMWFRLSCTGSKSTNDNILNTYLQEMKILGLEGNIGLYATKDELSNITWSKHKNDWWLLYRNHPKSIPSTKELLEPKYFVVS